MKLRFSVCSFLLCLSATLLGCRSRGIDLTIQNHGGTAVRNVEVDYPGAAFGIARLGPGDSYAYRIKPLKTAEVFVSFEQGDGKTFKQKGPTLHATEAGQMTFVLEQDMNQQWRMTVEQK